MGYGPVRPLHETLRTIGLAPARAAQDDTAGRRKALEESRRDRLRQREVESAKSNLKAPAARESDSRKRIRMMLEEIEGLTAAAAKPAVASAPKGSGPVVHMVSICAKAEAKLVEGKAKSKGAGKAKDVFKAIRLEAEKLLGKSMAEDSVRTGYIGLARHLVGALGLVREDWESMGVNPSVYRVLARSVIAEDGEEPTAPAKPEEPAADVPAVPAAATDEEDEIKQALGALKKAVESKDYDAALSAATMVAEKLRCSRKG